MTKEFRPHASNIIGTDLSKYKVVDQWQFACDFMSTIRVRKLPVVMQEKDEQIIVSPAYTTFEVIDSNELHPEYLMMWFRRSEFDRYAYFCCDSAVRGGFNWDELCNVQLPIPSIEKQRAIVKEYKTIVNRIKLNEQLIQKLEETAQALYKHWFVDFEFPNENGQPYKSSGGKMVYNEELNKEIPARWKVGTLELLGEIVGGATPSKSVSDYWTENSDAIRWISPKDLTKDNYKFIDKGQLYITQLGYQSASTKLLPQNSVLFSSRAPIGILGITTKELCTNQGFKSIIPFDQVGCYYVYYFLKYNTNDIAGQGSGTTFNEVSGTVMKEYPAYLPSLIILDRFSGLAETIFNHQESIERSTKSLIQLKSIVLSRLSTVGSSI